MDPWGSPLKPRTPTRPQRFSCLKGTKDEEVELIAELPERAVPFEVRHQDAGSLSLLPAFRGVAAEPCELESFKLAQIPFEFW